MQVLFSIIGVVIALFIAIKIMVLLFHGAWGLIAIAAEVLWIAALVHIAFNRFPNFGTKVLWFVAVFLTNFLGAVVYFLIGQPRERVQPYAS